MSFYTEANEVDEESSVIQKHIKEAQKAKEEEKLRMAFHDKNPIVEASWWSRLMFSWTTPVLSYSKNHQLDIKYLGNIRKEHDVKIQKARLTKAWNSYKSSKSSNSLLKAVLSAYKREYAITTSIALVVCCLQAVSPFLLKALIDYI